MNDDELMQRLTDGLHTPVPEPSPSRVAAVRQAATRTRDLASPVASTAATTAHVSTRRTWLMTAAAAAVGAVGGAVLAGAGEDQPTATPGPPTEPLSFSRSATSITGSTVAGSTINHTWGVELLLDATGFPVGDRFAVEFVGRDGVAVSAGGFVGSEMVIHCRCNGALLRDEIAAIEIRDATGRLVSSADFT